MIDKKYKVEDLFSDSGPFDTDKVATVLYPLITIQNKTNKIFIKSHSLPAKKKILAYTLAKKLLKNKSFIDNDKFTASELFKETGIKKGTIDPAIMELKDEGLIVGKAEYEIPTSKIELIIEILS